MTDSVETATGAEPATLCLNCSTPLYGQFCYQCGQNQKNFNRYLINLIGEAFEDVIAPDSRAARTLVALLFRPGFLTQEYFAGRRARYVQPVRLYFVTSVIFFGLMSLLNTLETSDAEPKNPIAVVQTENKDGNYIEDLDLPFLTTEEVAATQQKLNTQIGKAVQLAKDNPSNFKAIFVDRAPPVIFCLLPLFAMLLQLLYLFQGRYYAEHIVLAVHSHSFVYIALIIDSSLQFIPQITIREGLQGLLAVWMTAYLFLSLKTIYRQGWFVTSMKFLLLGFCYLILFSLFAFIAFVIGIMSI